MNLVLLLAGGIGCRMGLNIPKQHITVFGKQIIDYTLEAFSISDAVDQIYIVSSNEGMEECLKRKKTFSKVREIIEGGETRSVSVYNAILFLSNIANKTDKIIVSDIVRPCITLREIQELFDALNTYCAATSTCELYETLLHTDENKILNIIQRDGLLRQTAPEAYRFSVLEDLYLKTDINDVKNYKNIGIDQLYQRKIDIGLVNSTNYNFKITTPVDVQMFKSLINNDFKSILYMK